MYGLFLFYMFMFIIVIAKGPTGGLVAQLLLLSNSKHQLVQENGSNFGIVFHATFGQLFTELGHCTGTPIVSLRILVSCRLLWPMSTMI
jgi:hypothetical protein